MLADEGDIRPPRRSLAEHPHYVAQPDRLLGLSPVADQHWAAWVMTIEQLLAFGTLTLLLVGKIPIPEPPEPAERGEPI